MSKWTHKVNNGEYYSLCENSDIMFSVGFVELRRHSPCMLLYILNMVNIRQCEETETDEFVQKEIKKKFVMFSCGATAATFVQRCVWMQSWRKHDPSSFACTEYSDVFIHTEDGNLTQINQNWKDQIPGVSCRSHSYEKQNKKTDLSHIRAKKCDFACSVRRSTEIVTTCHMG